jgi:DNA-binding beta-propeller fold protein YncE
MRLLIAASALALLAACQPEADAPAAPAQPAAPAMQEIAFIANAEAATVSLLDVATQKIVATIDTNPDKMVVERPGTPNYAQDTDISPDGKTLYVSRGYMKDVAAFDIATGSQLWVTPVDAVRADHMTITPDGASLFVSALTDNRVRKLDAATGAVQGSFVSGIYPHDNQVSADGATVYNTSLGNMQTPLDKRDHVETPSETSGYAYEFTTVDAATLEVKQRTRMPFGIRPWHFNPDGTVFYAQFSNFHAVAMFEYPSGKELKRLDLPSRKDATEADWDFEAIHHGLAITHDGKTLCLAGRASDYVALVKAPELELITTIPVDDAPGWATLSLEDTYCFVPNTRADTISIISLAEAKEVARVPAGNGPKHVTVARIPAEVVAAASARP